MISELAGKVYGMWWCLLKDPLLEVCMFFQFRRFLPFSMGETADLQAVFKKKLTQNRAGEIFWANLTLRMRTFASSQLAAGGAV